MQLLFCVSMHWYSLGSVFLQTETPWGKKGGARRDIQPLLHNLSTTVAYIWFSVMVVFWVFFHFNFRDLEVLLLKRPLWPWSLESMMSQWLPASATWLSRGLVIISLSRVFDSLWCALFVAILLAFYYKRASATSCSNGWVQLNNSITNFKVEPFPQTKGLVFVIVMLMISFFVFFFVSVLGWWILSRLSSEVLCLHLQWIF